MRQRYYSNQILILAVPLNILYAHHKYINLPLKVTDLYSASYEASVWQRIVGYPRELLWLSAAVLLQLSPVVLQHLITLPLGPAWSVALSQTHSDETDAPPQAMTTHLQYNTKLFPDVCQIKSFTHENQV